MLANARAGCQPTRVAVSPDGGVRGSLPAGLFPRDLAYDAPAGQILVANCQSQSVGFLRAPPLP